MPDVKAQALGIETEARGGNPLSSCPIAGVFVRVQDAHQMPVLMILVATTENIVTGVANLERRRWHRGIGRRGSCNRGNVNALIHHA